MNDVLLNDALLKEWWLDWKLYIHWTIQDAEKDSLDNKIKAVRAKGSGTFSIQ